MADSKFQIQGLCDSSSSSSSEEEDTILDLLVLLDLKRKRKRKIERRWWVHAINRRRYKYGEYHRLVRELQFDGERFHRYFRMSREQFKQLLFLCEEDIAKQSTQFRDAISPRQRLAITIRFLATGNSYTSLSFNYRVGISTISYIVPQVCKVLWSKLSAIYMCMPKDANDWKLIAKNFEIVWHLPHCLGSLDGKHIIMKAPDNTGSQYFNYKGSFSIVLLALVDASYRFVAVDIGSYGRNSDGGIFSHSKLGKALKSNKLLIPGPDPLPNDTELGPMPYFMVGDEAFPLMKNLMRPFPGGKKSLPEDKAIFNYRLCRARRIVENAFGILAARWRLYHTVIMLNAENTTTAVKATTALHNYLQTTSTPAQIASISAEAEDIFHRGAFTSIKKFGTRGSTEAEIIRDKLKHYFENAGQTSFQLKHVRRGKSVV